MADVADDAAHQEELALSIARSVRKPAGPVATGFCLNCGEELASEQRWCNAECRNDWEKLSGRAK